MEDASHFDVGVKIASILLRHEKPIRLVTVFTQRVVHVKEIAQHGKEGALAGTIHFWQWGQ